MFFTTYHSDIGLRAASDDAAKTNNKKNKKIEVKKHTDISLWLRPRERFSGILPQKPF